MAAAGSDQQEFDAAAADPVTNRGHLLASPQPAELREAKELNGRPKSVGSVRDQTWFSTFRGTSTHNCRVHDLVRVWLEHSLVLGDFDDPAASAEIAGILLHTCDPLAGATVFPLSRQEDFWKTCTVFAVIGNSRQDTNRLPSICSHRP
jgi:hypothetical protein